MDGHCEGDAATAAVALWSIALDAAGESEDLQSLPADERWRAAQIIVPSVRRRFVRARAGLRRILGAELGIAAHTLALTYGAHGKPALHGYPALHFNLSHSGERALLAISTQGEVGVDLEQLRERASVLPLAQRFLSEAESAYVAAAHGSARDHAFLRCWTRKEAVLKATGRGIGVDTRVIDVGLVQCAPTLRVAHDPRALLLCDLELGVDWVGALCLAPVDAGMSTIRIRSAGFSGACALDRQRAA